MVEWGPNYFHVPKRILVGLLRAQGGRIVWSEYDEVLQDDEAITVYVEEFEHKTVIELGDR